jgi:hypothetical protein
MGPERLLFAAAPLEALLFAYGVSTADGFLSITSSNPT